ncbi:MAG: hypothetical protein FWC78_05025 [Defluviitaleaceae bacterium]|nr:hypothetical protein [Defluviitaleaceae bacterium]
MKAKEILKIAAVSALTLGLFSAVLVGVNHWTLASATAGTATIDLTPLTAQATAYNPQAPQQEPATAANAEATTFTPPTVTFVCRTPEFVFDDPSRNIQRAPANALPQEDALLIGAEHIWDVFGTCIDGMYVEMSYAVMPGFTRPFWVGTVYETNPPALNFEDFRDDLDAWWDAQVFSSYSFRLDAITGMRIDVSYANPSYHTSRRSQGQEVIIAPVAEEDAIRSREQIREENNSWAAAERTEGGRVAYIAPDSPLIALSPEEARAMHRNMEVGARWQDMSTEEHLAASDITPARLEAYTQKALELAQRHFHQTTVQTIEIGDAWRSGGASMFFTEELYVNEAGDIAATIGSISFLVTDNTGREAEVRIPTATAHWRLTSVQTMHNEFIPGFEYHGPGIG